MSGFKRRRDPDPSKPGTIYRSKPGLGRRRGLSDGPPYLNEPPRQPAARSAAGDDGRGRAGRGSAGLGSVDQIYAEHGGDGGPDSPYGNQYDSARDPHARDGEPGRPYPGVTSPPRRRRRPPIGLIAGLVVLVLVGYPLLLGATAWKSLNRIDALSPAHAIAEPSDTPGRTYLVVGSDSRADLTAAERKRLGTGSAAGQRTDTIMLLHVPPGGGVALISLPRDSYVPIPGHSRNKINAAYAFGGAPLLVRTVENVTGIRIDGYVETGLGGFATIVDALGGVTLCPKFAMNDHDAHINLKKGCQSMDGKTALGYARARHSDPRGDLGRVERQRETLAAIAKKTLSPATLLQPWRAFPAAKAGGGALTVDEHTSTIGLAKFVLAMRAVSGGGGVTLTVPISNPNYSSSAGSAVLWNSGQALRLFTAIRTNDMTVVKSLAAAQKKANG